MTPTVFLSAYTIDIIVGDPRWFPHPVAIIGRWTRFVEGKIRARTTRASEKKGGKNRTFLIWLDTNLKFFLTASGERITYNLLTTGCP